MRCCYSCSVVARKLMMMGQRRFMEDLKDKCTKKKGNPEFWEKVKEVGREISMISDEEAKRHGGTSQYTEDQAVQVRLSHSLNFSL